MPNIQFDTTKIQYETERRRKRQQLLRLSLPGMILVAVIALWLILPVPLTHQAITNYKQKHYQTARNWLTPLTWTSPEPFVAAFDSGTVDTQLGNYILAETELTRALKLAPAAKRCMVVQNLVFALKAHSASIKQQTNTTDATTYDSQATAYQNEYKKCFQESPGTKKDDKSGATGGGGGGGGGGGESQSPTLSPAQVDQLQQKNQQSQQPDLLQTDIDPNSPAVKPW